MNRRTLVIGTAAIAALLFVVGWFTVDRSASPVLKNDAPTGSALIRFHSPVIGPQDAPVTIVEFFDPACEACRAMHPVLQNLFEPVLEALLAAQPQWADHSGARLDIAWAAAADAGLDVDKARAAMDSSAIDNVLAQDALDVETVGVRQTPTFFVDGRPLLDYGAEQLIEMVRLQVEARS